MKLTFGRIKMPVETPEEREALDRRAEARLALAEQIFTRLVVARIDPLLIAQKYSKLPEQREELGLRKGVPNLQERLVGLRKLALEAACCFDFDRPGQLKNLRARSRRL